MVKGKKPNLLSKTLILNHHEIINLNMGGVMWGGVVGVRCWMVVTLIVL